jgi:hypothetical protein
MRHAQVELQNGARSLGLHINTAKTDVLEGPAVAEEALEIEHSAVDDALDNKDDSAPLEELIDRLLEQPDKASRTSLRFVAKRMRDHESHYRVVEFTQQAQRMPQAADSLALLFKEVFSQSSLQDWYLDYAKGDWVCFQWPLAHYLRMFPSATPPRKPLRDFVTATVDDADTSLPLLAAAAQRLSSWDPSEARAVIRSALSRSSHPQYRRILILAAAQAGETRTNVRKWLSQEPENELTLKLIEHRNYAPPKVVPDYEN